VIGETVNLASRLESLNKSFRTEILLSAATVELAGAFPGLSPLGPAKVAGLEEPVQVFTLSSNSPVEPATMESL
jgi:adenylate cyclase